MEIQLLSPVKNFYATSLEEAHSRGFMCCNLTRDKLFEIISKDNPTLRLTTNSYGGAIADTNLDPDKAFICGIGNNRTIPKFTIVRYDRDKVKKLETQDV